MLNKLIEFSVRSKLVVGLMVIALVGIVAYQTTQLPIEAVPDMTINRYR